MSRWDKQTKKIQTLRGCWELKQEDASDGRSHVKATLLHTMRVPEFPLAPSPDQFCPHHRHSLINMDDASLDSANSRCHVADNSSKAATLPSKIWVPREFKGLRSGKRKALRACSHQTLTKRLTICAALRLVLVVIRTRRTRIRRRETSVPTNCRASASVVARFGMESSDLFLLQLPIQSSASCTVACHELTQYHALCK